MPWVFCVTIERDHDAEIMTEQNYVLAERIEDVFMDYRLDSLDERCTITAIERKVPIVRQVKSYAE